MFTWLRGRWQRGIVLLIGGQAVIVISNEILLLVDGNFVRSCTTGCGGDLLSVTYRFDGSNDHYCYVFSALSHDCLDSVGRSAAVSVGI